MNQIDQLISQAGIQGTFDLRCLYRGGFRLPGNPPEKLGCS